jgi:galactokinase
VLPLAIDRDTRVAAAPGEGGRFRVVSREQAADQAFAPGDPVRRGDWGDYARGVVAALAEEGFTLSGADLAVASDVPLGAGLSSSASLCVALATALDAAFSLGLGPRRRAEIAHRAESGFVGVPCGVMDPFASALGREGHVLRIDCRSLEVLPVPVPAGAVLLVAHSGVTRRLAAGDYAVRRRECEQALALARESGALPADARSWRDVSAASLPALAASLPDALLRRARHVVTENERVRATCAALEAGDLAAAGALLREGMRSLRDDFEVSVPELDALCALGDAAPGVLGSRLTGAGFGGCTLHLVREADAEAAARAIAAGFEARFGRLPPIWPVRPADGAEVEETP